MSYDQQWYMQTNELRLHQEENPLNFVYLNLPLVRQFVDQLVHDTTTFTYFRRHMMSNTNDLTQALSILTPNRILFNSRFYNPEAVIDVPEEDDDNESDDDRDSDYEYMSDDGHPSGDGNIHLSQNLHPNVTQFNHHRQFHDVPYLFLKEYYDGDLLNDDVWLLACTKWNERLTIMLQEERCGKLQQIVRDLFDEQRDGALFDGLKKSDFVTIRAAICVYLSFVELPLDIWVV
jgi:hypothetical protein